MTCRYVLRGIFLLRRLDITYEKQWPTRQGPHAPEWMKSPCGRPFTVPRSGSPSRCRLYSALQPLSGDKELLHKLGYFKQLTFSCLSWSFPVIAPFLPSTCSEHTLLFRLSLSWRPHAQVQKKTPALAVVLVHTGEFASSINYPTKGSWIFCPFESRELAWF